MTGDSKSDGDAPRAWHERRLFRAALFFVFLAALFAIVGEVGALTAIFLGIAGALAVLQVAMLGSSRR